MVTQVTGTYADLCTWENLYLAYRRAARGKRGRQAAAGFEYRLEDNLIAGQWHWGGLARPWFSLVWFWIPAHTLTFSLPPDYQLGLAALWSVVLGVILGWRRPPASVPGK